MDSLTLNYWLKQHWKLLVLIFIGLCILGQVIFQIVYPSSTIIPGVKVDGVNVGGMKYADAVSELNGLYGGLKLNIYFGSNGAAFQTPKMSDVGIGVDNTERLSILKYPYILRFIPGSIFWAPALEKPGTIVYNYDKDKIADYTLSKVGADCSVPPQNASLKLVDSQLQVVPSSSGGTCDINQFQGALAEVKPSSDVDNAIHIDINETAAPVTDDMARDLAAKLNGRLAQPMPISVDTTTDTIPGRVVLSWLDFKANVPEQTIDNTGNQSASLQYSINNDRMLAYLDQGIASKLVVKPGVSHVSTSDFKETSRVNGANGRDIDIAKAAISVQSYIDGKATQATGATVVVGPSTIYTRSYSPTSVGFSALLSGFAQDNPGTWGLAFNELSGVDHPRSASFNADARMKAGSIDSLYIAYTYVIQEYNGVARPVDIVTGSKTAAQCQKLMLQQFNEACREGMYNYFGYATLTSTAASLGLKNTVFASDQTVTSANDLQTVMLGLYNNKIGRIEGAQSIVSLSRAIQDNEGIPAGAPGDEFAHVIGQTDTVHNDTAIVYDSDHGTYALSVMSDGSSWDKIANLVKKIQTLKAVKIPPTAR